MLKLMLHYAVSRSTWISCLIFILILTWMVKCVNCVLYNGIHAWGQPNGQLWSWKTCCCRGRVILEFNKSQVGRIWSNGLLGLEFKREEAPVWPHGKCPDGTPHFLPSVVFLIFTIPYCTCQSAQHSSSATPLVNLIALARAVSQYHPQAEKDTEVPPCISMRHGACYGHSGSHWRTIHGCILWSHVQWWMDEDRMEGGWLRVQFSSVSATVLRLCDHCPNVFCRCRLSSSPFH